ncbi:hypothetical protein BGZ95_004746 [Linnemannia exigua]|uniref:Uncharacterized protein n=1 Tax=Linnemannia exigua TaxID=604196 RepID=A0AAD4H1Y5_9FUNG|nr:hypothetical protein BGZ95_004746 [Linnemannia exigua]
MKMCGAVRWANYKVFPAAADTNTISFEHEQSYANARDSFANVKLRENVRCTNVTHAGRHSGSVEAQEIGISVEDIRQDHGDLMRMIFPFIENALFIRETEPVEYKLWIEAINREMNDVDSGVEALDRSKAPTSSSKGAVRGGDSVMAYQLA